MADHPFIASGCAATAMLAAGVNTGWQSPADKPPSLEAFLGKEMADNIVIISGQAGADAMARSLKAKGEIGQEQERHAEWNNFQKAAMANLKSLPKEKEAGVIAAAKSLDAEYAKMGNYNLMPKAPTVDHGVQTLLAARDRYNASQDPAEKARANADAGLGWVELETHLHDIVNAQYIQTLVDKAKAPQGQGQPSTGTQQKPAAPKPQPQR